MVQETGSEAQFIKEAIWKYAQYVVVLLACFGAGIFVGYELWGDAPSLRKERDHYIEEVNRLKNERTNMESKFGIITSRLDKCTKDMGDVKQRYNSCFQELQTLKQQQTTE